MEVGWEKSAASPTLGPYAQWEIEALRGNPRAGPDILLPVFVRLNLPPEGSIDDVVQKLLHRRPQIIVPDTEFDHLLTLADRMGANGDRIGPLPENARIQIYTSPDAIEDPLWQVLHVGPPAGLTLAARTDYRGRIIVPLDAPIERKPIVASVDDGIGYLNRRFRGPDGLTRFRAIWLQTTSRVFSGIANGMGQEVYLGRVLTAPDIDPLITAFRDEADAYRRQSLDLVGPEGHKSTILRRGHGTHVLDIAAGALQSDAMADVPLLAVQLPPSALGEVASGRLDTYLLSALRWIMVQSLRVMEQDGRRYPLIINLSLGALAGPGDGTSFVEQWIADEIAAYDLLSGSAPIRIVAAYGNAHRDRLVAQATVAPAQPMSLALRVQPDDRTFSFLELRVPKGRGADVTVTIQSPDPDLPVLNAVNILAPGQAVMLMNGGTAPIAAALGGDEVNHDLLLIALAPTTRDDPRPVAPPGEWAVSIANVSGTVIAVSAKVRRDDTPSGYRPGGRQSWLETPDGWTWDVETKDWVAPAPTDPVTRTGTAVGYAGVPNRAVIFVGATGPGWDPAGQPVPARYSAAGGAADPGSSVGPRLSARADLQLIRPGRLGAGVQSGVVLRQSGTSVAAPLAVRALVQGVLAGGLRMDPVAGSDQTDAELAWLLDRPYPIIGPFATDGRLGLGLLAQIHDRAARHFA